MLLLLAFLADMCYFSDIMMKYFTFAVLLLFLACGGEQDSEKDIKIPCPVIKFDSVFIVSSNPAVKKVNLIGPEYGGEEEENIYREMKKSVDYVIIESGPFGNELLRYRLVKASFRDKRTGFKPELVFLQITDYQDNQKDLLRVGKIGKGDNYTISEYTEIENCTIIRRSDYTDGWEKRTWEEYFEITPEGKIKANGKKLIEQTVEIVTIWEETLANNAYEFGAVRHFNNCSFDFRCDCCDGLLIFHDDLSFYHVDYCMSDETYLEGSYTITDGQLILNYSGICVREMYNYENEINEDAVDYISRDTIIEPFSHSFYGQKCDDKVILVTTLYDERYAALEAAGMYEEIMLELKENKITGRMDSMKRVLSAR